MKDEIKRIQEYVWARHIDGSDHYDRSVDETEAIQTLSEHYSAIGNRNSSDQMYLGILLFERAFEHPDEQDELFGRAKKILEFYRRVAGEDDWEPVEDRLADIRMHFGEPEEEPVAVVVEEPPPPPAPVEPPPPPKPVEPEVIEDDGEEEAPVGLSVDPIVAPAPRKERPAPEPEPESEAVEAPEAPSPEEETVKRRAAAEAVIAGLEVVDGMQLVPAGSFLFGRNEQEVFLDTFYVDREPVTNGEYMRFVRETGYRLPRYVEDTQRNAPAQPVVGISYRDAVQFAKWAGKELPTEYQWEKAARGTDGRPFPWGNDPPGASDACFGQDPATGAPTVVGKTLRNVSPFGVHDMCGNVWEWTCSAYEKDGSFLVARGGSYNDSIEFLHVDFRLEVHPKDKCEAVGFRCVKNVHH